MKYIDFMMLYSKDDARPSISRKDSGRVNLTLEAPPTLWMRSGPI